ncbi:MAG TPA: hypothetical protein PK771_12375 [Spirochaetota bacterium]|nr:hypothetical protein [Spirochaetota bacterium]
MVNYLIFEFLLVALTFISPNIKNGEFEMINSSGKNTRIEFRRDDNFSQVIEGAHELILKDKESATHIRFRFIDNGLYEVYPVSENPEDFFELDIMNYFMDIQWDKIKTKKQEIKTIKNKDTMIIQPKKDFLEISLKKDKSIIRINYNLVK